VEFNLEFEEKHKAIIDHCGRYPHHNKILGCESTLEEIKFLRQPDSSFLFVVAVVSGKSAGCLKVLAPKIEC
jgi:hypothetical protein